MSAKEKKAEAISALEQLMTRCSVGVLTDYRGLSGLEMTKLRRKLRAAGVDYKVVKNTMARFAAKHAGKEELSGLFTGPVGVVFGYGDITATTKVVADYIQETKSILAVKGGFIGMRLITAEEVIILSRLPSREVLLARVVGGLASPISALVGALQSPMQGLLGLLDARIKQLEGG